MVKKHEPFLTPPQVSLPGVTNGVPQHFVMVTPVFANGVTVTGTQTDTDCYPTAGQVWFSSSKVFVV